jgi:hypothetical protein
VLLNTFTEDLEGNHDGKEEVTKRGKVELENENASTKEAKEGDRMK